MMIRISYRLIKIFFYIYFSVPRITDLDKSISAVLERELRKSIPVIHSYGLQNENSRVILSSQRNAYGNEQFAVI